MKLNYYKETDSLCIDQNKPSSRSEVVSDGVVLDYDEKSNLVGIDIDNASRKIDLNELTLSKLPIHKETL